MKSRLLRVVYWDSAAEISDLVVGVFNKKPVYLRDVADIRLEADSPESYVTFGTAKGAAHAGLDQGVSSPAVTIAIAKQPGKKCGTVI